MGNVLHVNGGAVEGLDGKVVQLTYRFGTTVHLDVVFQGADFCGAGGQNEILLINGINDVHRGKTLGLQGGGVGIDGDEALLSSVGEGSCRALDGRKLSANEIVAKVEELLLAEGVTG